MAISRKILSTMEKSSWIRRMFEAGAKLKAEHGNDNVFDFSLGNPNLEPPREFQEALSRQAAETSSGLHSYMPNAGYPAVREKVAAYISGEYGIPLDAGNVIMTVGAGGALNVALKSLINHGDYILCPSPYFMEYQFYCDNHGGILNTVPTGPDFLPNIERLAEEIGPRTAALIINFPNNPTGTVYTQEDLMWIEFFLNLKDTGMSLKEIKYYISLKKGGLDTVEERKNILLDHVDTIDEKIQELLLTKKDILEQVRIYEEERGNCIIKGSDTNNGNKC